MIDTQEIKAFLTEQGYWIKQYPDRGVLVERIYRVDGWEAYSDTFEPLYHLQRAVGHYLEEQLGRHWQRLWAYQAMKETCEFFYEALDASRMVEIEKAIAYYEALEKESATNE